jgi:hypothetical protein
MTPHNYYSDRYIQSKHKLNAGLKILKVLKQWKSIDMVSINKNNIDVPVICWW